MKTTPPQEFTWSGGGRFTRHTSNAFGPIFFLNQKYGPTCRRNLSKKKKSSKGKRPQLNNAPKMRGAYEIDPDVMECQDTMKHARKKLDVRMASPILWNRNVLLFALAYMYSFLAKIMGHNARSSVTAGKEVGQTHRQDHAETHTGRIFQRPNSCGDGRQIIMEWTRGRVRIPQWSQRIGVRSAGCRLQNQRQRSRKAVLSSQRVQRSWSEWLVIL